MSSHYIVKCPVCHRVIEQCRCFAPDKRVIHRKCNACRALDGESGCEYPATPSQYCDPASTFAKAPTEPPPTVASGAQNHDLKAQVYDLSMRRTSALQTDPALRLAEKIVAVMTANTDTLDAVDHLIALELAGRATCETIKHARGETWLNACIVDASRRIQAYEISWPEDGSKTIYDEKKEEPTKEVGSILAFPPKPEKT